VWECFKSKQLWQPEYLSRISHHPGNKYVRRLIWMLSIVTVRTVPQYRAYFQRRVAQGKPKMHILVAVGRKLLSAFYPS
jgi:hypothetical protein